MKIQALLGLFSPGGIENMMHVITAAAKDHSVVTRMWLYNFHVPDIPGDVRNKEVLSMTLQQIFRQTQPPSHFEHWCMTYRESLSSWSEKGSLFPSSISKTAVGSKTTVKTWSFSTSSVSRGARTFSFASPQASVNWQSTTATDHSAGKT